MFKKNLSTERKPLINISTGLPFLQPKIQPKPGERKLPVGKYDAHANEGAPILDPFKVRERLASDRSDHEKEDFQGFKYLERYYDINKSRFSKVPGFDHIISLETKGQTLYFQRYFVPEIIKDDAGKEIADPKLGHYYLEEMLLETETEFDYAESYHTQRSNTNVVRRVPIEEQDIWVNFRHRHLGYDINRSFANATANETHLVPGSMNITSLNVTLNPESAEDFNLLFSEGLRKSYPENLTIDAHGISDMENFAFLATYTYEYQVFRPKIP